MSDPEKTSPDHAGAADAAQAPAASLPSGPAPAPESLSGPAEAAERERPSRFRRQVLAVALTAIALALSLASLASWISSRPGQEERPDVAARPPAGDPEPEPLDSTHPEEDPAPSGEALKAAGRREIERAIREDPEAAWLYIEEIERFLGRDDRAADAQRRREEIAEKRRVGETYVEELRSATENLDVQGLGFAEATAAATRFGAGAHDFRRARVILWSMLSRSGDLSGRFGAIAPDIIMGIADSYRDEALLAREGAKEAKAPPNARILEPKEGEEGKK